MKSIFRNLALVSVFFLFQAPSFANNPKKIKKLMEKLEFVKAKQTIEKLIKEDTNSVNGNYCHSLLRINPAYESYNIDSAYIYILRSISNLKLKEDRKVLEKLKDLGISDSTLTLQRKKIETIAYEKTIKEDTLPKYHHFLNTYKTSEINQISEIEKRMHTLEFEITKKKHNYQSYFEFMQKFPYAIEVAEASKEYERLVYENKTKDKTASSLKKFIKEHPQSPYRELVELDLFKIISSSNEISDLINFIIEIQPLQKTRKYALEFIEEQLKQKTTIDTLKLSDAEKEIILPIKKTLEKNKVDFFFVGFGESKKELQVLNQEAKSISKEQIKQMPEEYNCGGIEDDFFIIYEDDKAKLKSTKDKLILEGKFSLAGSLGAGLIQYVTETGVGVVHQNGWKVLPPHYEEVELLNKKFIRVKNEKKYALFSFSGIKITELLFDDIEAIDNFIILKNKDKITVENTNSLIPSRLFPNHEFKFEYDDTEKLSDGKLLAFKDSLEALIDENLKQAIPLSKNEILFLSKNIFYTETEKGASIYDVRKNQTKKIEFEELEHNKDWLSLRKGDLWSLNPIHTEITFNKPAFKYEEVDFLSDKIALAKTKTEIHVFLSNQKTLKFKNSKQSIRVLKSESPEDILLEISHKNGSKSVLDKDKKEIIKFNNQASIERIGEYLIVEQLNKKYIYNTKGKKVLKYGYDGVSSKENKEKLHLLRKQKFGALSSQINGEENYISPKYSKLLKEYNQQYFIAEVKGKYGFIDLKGNKVSNTTYDRIEYLSDSLALVQSGSKWEIFNLNEKEIEEDLSFDKYKLLGDNKFLKITKDAKDGIIALNHNWQLDLGFNNISNVGSETNPIFCCEKFVKEASIYVMIYYNKKGVKIKQTVLEEDEFQKIICDDL